MRQILPYYLWLGHAGDGREYHQIFDAGIRAIVQLAEEELPLQPPRELIYCRFPLVDGPGNELKVLHLATVTVANLLERHVPTLVCCGGGMSRSPAIAAAALAMVAQKEPDECLKQITEHQPHDVVPGFWNEVKSLAEFERF
jgi:protein-tyrosine phosphatase